MAVIVDADSTEKIVSTSVVTGGGVTLTLDTSAIPADMAPIVAWITTLYPRSGLRSGRTDYGRFGVHADAEKSE